MTKDIATKSDDRFSRFQSPEHEAPNFESRREIRLCGPQTSGTGIDEGQYYIVDYNKGDGPEYTAIGEEISVVILRDCMRLRKWNEDENRNDFDSTEFRSFKDYVVLFDQRNIPTTIKAALPYTHKNEEAPMMGGTGDRSLKLEFGLGVRYFCYILYEDEVFRMSFASTDNAGATEEEKPCGFDSPSEDSFMGLKSETNKLTKDRLFMFKVILGSNQLQIGKKKDGTPEYSKKMRPKTFVIDKQMDTKKEEDAVYEKLVTLYKELANQMWNKYCKAREETKDSDLDRWSIEVLEGMDSSGPETLLYESSNDELPELSVSDAEIVDVTEQAKNEFPPSEETIQKQKQKVKEMTEGS